MSARKSIWRSMCSENIPKPPWRPLCHDWKHWRQGWNHWNGIWMRPPVDERRHHHPLPPEERLRHKRRHNPLIEATHPIRRG